MTGVTSPTGVAGCWRHVPTRRSSGSRPTWPNSPRLLTAARAETNDITAKELRLQAICRLDESLRSKPWDDYDEAQAKGECERAEAFYRELEQSDEFREAEALRAKAEARLEAANEAVQKALVAQQANEEKLKDIEDQIHDLEQRAKRGRDEGSPLSVETKRAAHQAV